MSSKTKSTATKEEATPALVPKLRFPEFRGAEGWRLSRLDSLCERIMDGTHFSPKSTEGPRPYLTSKNIRNGHLDLSTVTYISEEEHRAIYSRCPVKQNDVLLTKDGANTGNCAINYLDYEFSLLSSVAVLRANRRLIDPAFLFQSISSDRTRKLIEDSMGGQAITRVTLEKISGFAIIVANVAEQQKIAECLSSLDELMAAQARKVDALKTHKKGLMQQLFPREGETQPRLRFPEFQNAGEWEEKKLGSVCDIQRGKFSHRPRNDPRFFGGPYPFIQTGDVVKSEGGAVIASQSLNEEGLAVSKLFKPTIVLITIAANIGDTGLLQTEGCFTDSVVGLIPKKEVIPVFLELVMRGQKENLNKVATTGAQKNINNEILREVSVLLPSVPEQQRIATCLSSLDALITAETQKHEALKTHKQGLMQQLFPSPEEVAA